MYKSADTSLPLVRSRNDGNISQLIKCKNAKIPCLTSFDYCCKARKKQREL